MSRFIIWYIVYISLYPFEYVHTQNVCDRSWWVTMGTKAFIRHADGRLTALHREVSWITREMTLKFESRFSSTAAQKLVKYQSDAIIMTPNLAVSRLHENWQ